MSRNVAVPDDLYQRAAELAAAEQLSVDDLVTQVLAGAVASHDFIGSRARKFDQSRFEAALQSIPDVDPDDTDRL